MTNKITNVVIVGAGFGGLNAAKKLGNKKNIKVTLIDKNNYHLFQPLLYQVATAGLSAEEIASPIRAILSKYKNIDVVLGNVQEIDTKNKSVKTANVTYPFDFLILACGASHNYFGKDEWQEFAPGMKTIEQAFNIRRKILLAFEVAEQENNPQKIEQLLTFVIVGGGPTGVELAGSVAEMSRYTLAKDFRHINLKNTKIILIEAGPRLLSSFSQTQSEYAHKDLERIGVEIKLNSKVIQITNDGVFLQNEFIAASTIIWAAGVQPSLTNKMLNAELDKIGRVKVSSALTLPGKNNIFVIGDQAHVIGKNNSPLPGLAPVAVQQGVHVAKNIVRAVEGRNLLSFIYFDKGQMATVGRGSAVAEISRLHFKGFFAWCIWLFIHIMYLVGFRNKLLVLIRWAWLYFTYSRGARLITYLKNSR